MNIVFDDEQTTREFEQMMSKNLVDVCKTNLTKAFEPIVSKQPPAVITIYSDGACKGNPGAGGWCASVKCAGDTKYLEGGEKNTTNNRMELQAVLQGLVHANALYPKSQIKVYVDSQYVKNGITDWIKKWKSNGWRTSSKEPVKNKDLWEALDKENLKNPLIEWNWVKAHSVSAENNEVDMRASAQAHLYK